MNTDDVVREHYRRDDLEAVVLAALRRTGADPDALRVEDLAGLDQHGDATFARAMLNHVGMNIADKEAVFAEVRRVLQPGARFAVFEQMRVAQGAVVPDAVGG